MPCPLLTLPSLPPSPLPPPPPCQGEGLGEDPAAGGPESLFHLGILTGKAALGRVAEVDAPGKDDLELLELPSDEEVCVYVCVWGCP